MANETDGCRSCGRAHDPVAAALARLNQTLAGLEDEDRRLADDQVQLRQRREQLQAQRADLTRAISRRLATETGVIPREAPSRTQPLPAQGRRVATVPTRPGQTLYAGRSANPDQIPVGAETSPRGAQNALLILGGVLLGIAAIVAGVIYTTDAAGRAVFLAIATTVALAMAVLLARRTLTATAETIAGIGLLLVFLDGYAAYSANFAGAGRLDPPLYIAIIFGLVAAVAAAYRLATHLRAPQFAALLAVQPFLPLIAVHLGFHRDGFAAVFALVAALNLASVIVLRREVRFVTTARLRPAATGPTGEAWPRMLRELAWILFGLSLAASLVLTFTGFARATTVAQATISSLTLLLAAGIGAVGGRLAGRESLRDIGAGGLALAIIIAVTNVEARALPDYTVVLTAAIAAVIAVGAGFLPAAERRGPQLGSLIGAALTALVVTAEAARTAVATVRAGVTPAVWGGDIDAFTIRVHTTTWQIPVAAILLTTLALAATRGPWRVDAAFLGGLIIVLAAPGSASIPWWAIPLLGVAATTAATGAALVAPHARSAIIRSGVAGLLGLYAVGTSLARPGLTATTCALLATSAAAAAVLTAGWPDRFGPYADRVADAAGGAAALTLPVAVGTFAWLGGAPDRVLLSLTLLTAALGTVGAALSQVAARIPRTGSAGGALAAAAGCLVLSLVLDGATPADIGLSVLLLAAAAATAGSRAFEVSGSGLVEGVRSVPVAVSALADSFDNQVDRPEATAPTGRRRLRGAIDGMTLGAALSTAAVILAMARLLAVAVPGIGLVTTTAMVLLVSFAVLAVPEQWRRGPRLGAGAVGGAIGAVTAAIALVEAGRVLWAGTPFWAADLVTWPERAAAFAPYGGQIPACLALAAAAAVVLLPPPTGGEVGFVTLALAGLAAPAALGLAWWSPAVIAFAFALAAGVGAALVAQPAVAKRRISLAGGLGLYAAAAATATPGATALVLGAILAGGVVVATVAQLRRLAPSFVPGLAAAASLTAAPGAAATIAIHSGASRTAVLGSALLLAAFGVLVVAAVRFAGVPQGFGLRATRRHSGPNPSRQWGPLPAAGVATSSLVVAAAALTGGQTAQVWAAAAALVAVGAAATLGPAPLGPTTLGPELLGLPPLRGAPPAAEPPSPDLPSTLDAEPPEPPGPNRPGPIDRIPVGPDTRAQRAIIVATALPAALIAAIASAPAWLTALVGPYRTLRQIWQGYAVAPVPENAATATITLVLLTTFSAAMAWTLGGPGYILAAMLPPAAALALVAPTAVGAPRGVTAWVALAVAAATGLGAALSPPTRPAATRLLRGTAGIVCAITGAAGVAGSLATRTGTLTGLVIILAAAATAAGFGRDPAVRMVAWIVGSAAAFALPVTALAAAGRSLRPASFAVLAICAGLTGIGWMLTRAVRPAGTPVDAPASTSDRRRQRVAEASVLELCAMLGAALALLLVVGSARHSAAVLTIWGLLLGAAALRPDRSASHRQWLIRAALGAEVSACWLLLYSAEIGLPEAYTLPFAAVALLAGALELRHRRDLSSWTAYGPALAGGFLPSLALVLIGQDVAWRWVTLFLAAIAVVIVGTIRRRRAPVVTGAAVAVVTALVEMIRLLIGGNIAGAILVAVAGTLLIVLGALSEQRLRGALRKMS